MDLFRNGQEPTPDLLIKAFKTEAAKLALTQDFIDQGVSMMKRFSEWMDDNRERLTNDVTIVSLEEKLNFPLKVGANHTIVNYIYDRLDRTNLPDGEFDIEVIDYKSVGSPVPADQLRHRVQVRIYALAAQLAYPEARRIWVTYHLLRFDTVSMLFNREDNLETWRYLKDVYWRILQSDGTEETVNPECRWCVRRAVCKSLHKVEEYGGIPSLGFDRVADIYKDTDAQIKALTVVRDELATVLTDYLSEMETTHVTTETGTTVEVTVKTKRSVSNSNDEIARILGAERMLRYGKIGVTEIDKLIKSGEVTDDEAKQIRPLIAINYSSGLVVKADSPFED
jgi:hypothetical protein